MRRKAKRKCDVPGKGNGVVLCDVLVTAEMFVQVATRVIVIRYERESPAREYVLTNCV